MEGNANFGFSHVEREQTEAWKSEIAVLQSQLLQLCQELESAGSWGLLLEFPIPRRQQRIDVVLLAENLIFVLEFKSGSGGMNPTAARQAEDYALDLLYFHAPSHDRVIIPILVAPGVKEKLPVDRTSNVRSGGQVTPDRLGRFLQAVFRSESVPGKKLIDLREWNEGLYEPVPSVIEAATALYAGMSVREITRSHADSHNLTKTTQFVLHAVAEAQRRKEKVICFITGIPGAGKTLAGLNLVHAPAIHGEGRSESVFMSGNGPLVEILREALALDSSSRKGITKKEARKNFKTLIQNIHHFVQDNLERPDSQLPHEHAIVFDEAQRAWNADKNKKRYKERPPIWHISEPEMVLKIMDRHADWSVVIALVGGGQEIHEGEAGLAEWGQALQSYPRWRVLASPEAIAGGESVAGASLFGGTKPVNALTEEGSLHLETCIRSHQARDLATWVNRVLDGKPSDAARLAARFGRFPVMISRDLREMKFWLLENTRGNRRCGLTASSGAIRLRAYGIETSMAIREAYSYPHWFLKPRDDVRSSYQLEVVATEFEIQGLELDLVGLCWGGDFVWDKSMQNWRLLHFNGYQWKPEKEERRLRVFNKYRVLMTRAREGLMIWVPEGDENDQTRSVQSMNDTAEYLISCGAIPMISKLL